ncbi:MAG TPA: PTS glucose transporter subunit IIA, partial [Feifaniaceae bacterium]|nr:PTS glucose transporter subunit IIA [Feifaniaceae bacterium]
IRLMFETGHALSMAAEGGAELLIHVGIDTVRLKGRHFTKIRATGDAVKAGDVLLEFDPGAIREEGYDPVTVVVVLNPDAFSGVRFAENGPVGEGDALICIQPGR